MLLNRLLTGRSPTPRAATLENPRFDLNSPDAWETLSSTRTNTGRAINAESALTWSAWWRGVSILAHYCAKTPLFVYKEASGANGQGKTKALKHPAYKLLEVKANELQTAFQFQLALTGHAVNRGNGYAHIWRTRGGDPLELLLLDPDETYPVLDGTRLWYVTKISGEKRKLPSADVFHLKGFGWDGYQGYPLFQMAKETIGLGLAATDFKGVRYKNQARPSVILESANKIQKADRQELRQDWERMHTGIENAHRTAILDNGLKASKMTFTAEEMQEVENSGLSIRDAANFLGIPSHKLGDKEPIAYASLEQENQDFLDGGLDFWFCAHEDESHDKLLSESEKDSGAYTVEYDRGCVVKPSRADRANYLRTALAGQPWLTQNEAREEEGFEPHEDEHADSLTMPLNMGQGGAQNTPTDNADPPAGRPKKGTEKAYADQPPFARAAIADVLADTSRRMVRRIGTHAARAAKEPAKYLEFCKAFEAEHRDVVRESFGPAEGLVRAFRPGNSLAAGEIGDKLLALLRTEFNGAADSHSAKALPGAVEALAADQEARIALELVTLHLGEHHGP